MTPTKPEPTLSRPLSLEPPASLREPRQKRQRGRDAEKPASIHRQAIAWIRGEAKRW
ncbi:MAG: hypothetical protein JNL21_26520 [Myxococcales bacterium]|nr:hypothetical protein [Myxococcales bacterium]